MKTLLTKLILITTGSLLMNVSYANSDSTGCKAVAGFTTSANGTIVSFNNSSTGISNPRFTWNFGDGNSDFTMSPTHTYTIKGTYNVCLSYYDLNDSTCYDMVCQVIQAGSVCNAVAAYTPSVTKKTASFNNTSSGLTNPMYYWSFGDGSTAYTKNANHTYANNGTYTACLTVYDKNDSTCYDKVCKQIVIADSSSCFANYTYSQDSLGCTTSLCVAFTNTSTPSNAPMSWSFGDGQVSLSSSPTHCYTSAGTYLVCLTVALSDSTCQDMECKYVCVKSLTGINEKTSSTFELDNFPNPFSGSTTITYTLTDNSQVMLSVYDIIGQQVALIENGIQTSGKHTVEFDAGSLAKGMYILRLEINGKIISKKMMLTGSN